jgi:adenosylmethionine-8-amino-7-oxononanoate aminotransferase
VFFSDDGSTAVEVALKMAAQYWRHRGEDGRTSFIALEHAYHGDTFGAMAAGGIPLFHDVFRPVLFAVARAPAPHPYAFDGRRDEAACVERSLDALDRLLAEHGDRTAAVIVEPMLQGAGGMIVWPAAYLRGVRERTEAHGVLLIADEVLTGFGRTGPLFACEHGPVRPDILCLSKALTGGVLPLGATLCTDEVHGAFVSDDRRRTFFHGHSYTANPIACAAALESLRLIEDERVLARVGAIEARFRSHLERLSRHKAVADVRGIGAVAAIELATTGGRGYLDDLGPRLARAFLERDILLRPLGNVVYFLPPYVVTDAEIDGTFAVIEDVIEELASRAPR